MPAVPSYLTQFSAPSLFDAGPVEYPQGLFDIPAPGAPSSNPLASFGMSAAGGGLRALFNGGNPITGGVAAAASAAGGFAGNKLASWDNSPGEKIGGTIGGFAGSFLPIPLLGSFMGAGIGSAIGSNFGPPPTVGPNFQGWLGRNPMGQLEIAGASGDNGLTGDDARGALSDPVNAVNAYLMQNKLSLGDLPKHFQVRAGGNGFEPTIELGPYMAPMLNSNSLLKALIGKGYVQGDLASLGGPDPERIFNGTRWMEPESIHPLWQGGIHEVPGTGFKSLDTGRVGNAVPEAYAALTAAGSPVNDSTLALYARNPSLFSQPSQPSLFG